MKASDIINLYQDKTPPYLEKKRIGDITFSKGTYQVQVFDIQTNEELWPFIQFQEENEISDYFCSCEPVDETPYCEHIASSLLSIYQNHPLPLHIRFESSLWNQLGTIYAKATGYQSDGLKKESPSYYTFKENGQVSSFYIKSLSDEGTQFLETLLDNREIETEQTSLKFSNLSQQELTLWREGRPSEALRYELSFWSDLAKHLMLQQDKGAPYTLSFAYSEEGLPTSLHIVFENYLEIEFHLSKDTLSTIIPALANVHSPLPVHLKNDQDIDFISFDKVACSFHLHSKKSLDKKEKPQPSAATAHPPVILNDWIYIPKEGFYPAKHSFAPSKTIIPKAEINALLNAHHETFIKLLKEDKIHPFPIKPSYQISFDKAFNLHLSCYIFNPGDLQSSYSAFFGNWVYLEDDGFYQLDAPMFDFIEKMFDKESVSEFINQYRFWLNTQKGFETYLVNLDAQLTYSLDKNDSLTFQSYTDFTEEAIDTCDFGEWIYIEGQGFYSKYHGKGGLPVRPGVKIKKMDISLFIKMNYADLDYIQGFFSTKCPISKTGLRISLDSKNNIIIAPEFFLYPQYDLKKIRIFDHYTYYPEEGFFELPSELRMPATYRTKTIIPCDNQKNFIRYELSHLKKRATHLDNGLKLPQYINLHASHITEESTTETSFSLSLRLYYQTNLGAVNVIDLYDAIQVHKEFFFSPAGLIHIFTPEGERLNFTWVSYLEPAQLDRENRRINLSILDFMRLDALEGLHIEDAVDKRFVDALRNFTPPMLPNTRGMKGKLRPYQMIGLNWLWFLFNFGLSGLLCDDMGLGKTHQTMALMAAIRQKNTMKLIPDNSKPKKIKKKFLIVCPTSVIYHWHDKLSLYFPKIKTLVYYGLNRNLKTSYQKHDVILTSYGVLRLDQDIIQNFSFTLAIFDEIQVAKNHRSQTFQSLTKIKALMRLGLTGTPIENNLRELKTLFDLVLPGYMPNEETFRSLFLNPIERDNDPLQKELFKSFIKPFILRRKKSDVLEELPEKTVEISHCQLSYEQTRIYQDLLQQSRTQFIRDLEDESKSIPFIHIFALLSYLKQICNHPACYNKDIKNWKKYSSGKWDLFVELLNEAHESGQKVVVFSQYLNMLDIMALYLDDKKISYASIRGSTTNRAEQLKKFQTDPNCEVFLGSLKAVGLGIDLTAASIVIHYDRWWNAARENQATDRVHRMGQKRGVQVFKLITKGTLEEKIHQIIEDKGKLMEDIVTEEHHEQIKSFDRQDLIQLLQFIHTDIPPEETPN